MITIALQPTMGVAWHRFLAFFNIFFKRHADGRTSLGELQPITVGGEPLDFENVDDLDEDAALGVGKVEDFTWKGLLDFTHLHRVRSLPEPVPRLEHRQAALAQAARHDAARPRPREVAVAARLRGGPRRGHRRRRRLQRRHQGRRRHRAARRRDRLRHPPPADGLQPARARRRHRRGRPLVVHDVRRLRRAVPRRHRARRRHRRHAPLQEPHRVGLPRRAQRPVQEPREELQPVGPRAAPADGLGQGPARSRSSRSGSGRRVARRGRLPLLGRLRRRLRGPRQEDDPRGGRAARTPPASASPCSATARPAPATPPAGPATSSSSRCSPSRTSRPSTRPARRRSSSPARTASTRIKNEYPQLGGSYEVLHHTQLLNRLVREKRLVPVSRPGDASSQAGPPRPRRA